MNGTLKQWRKWREMSQPELGKAIGVHGNTILNWEKGYTEPSASEMEQLRKVLKLSATDRILLPKD